MHEKLYIKPKKSFDKMGGKNFKIKKGDSN
jgi:hypothetical protein